MSKTIVIIGTQFGDEGKGKIVDLFAERAGAVIRYQGGHNAGHTIVVDDSVFKLHLVPSGILHAGTRCFIGNGVVLSLSALLEEIQMLEQHRIPVREYLRISNICPLLFPFHVALDQAREKAKGRKAIGTTGRGIGPAYEDKIARRAIRVVDIFSPERFLEQLRELTKYYNILLQQVYQAEPLSVDILYQEAMTAFETIRPLITDVSSELMALHRQGTPLLFEGAQGTFLDIDHGTYPFVTSSNTTTGGVSTGSGFPPRLIDHVLGITKAYITRVGSGPLPTELHDETGQYLCEQGKEYGTTTGRRRRCGWFDAVLAKRAVDLNGITSLCITKLDVLDGLKKVKIATSYRLNGSVLTSPPADTELLAKCEPTYEELPGWTGSTANLTDASKLPYEAQMYLRRIEELAGASIDYISTGRTRDEVITINSIF